MANKQGEFQLKVASDKPNKFNLDKKVVATHDFGTLTPIECKLMLPGDKFDVNVNQFTYLMPMPKPTFGKIDTINRAFFVPFRVLFKDWKEFISNQKVAHVSEGATSLSYVPVAPQTTIREFTRSLISLMSENYEPTAGQLGRIYDASENYDFVYNIVIDGQLTKKYIVLTFMGRKLFTVLHGLGYNFPLIWYVGSSDADENAYELATKKVSLLPLLAFARAYFDWIIPSRFISAHRNLQCAISDIFAGFTDVNSTGSFNDGSGIIKAPMVIGLLKLYSSYLADDYFTSAFMTTFGYEDTDNVGYSTTLNNPNSGVSEDFKAIISNPSVSGDNSDLGLGASTQLDSQYIQQFTLKSLGALQDMINRGKVAGSKIQDYLRVTYGIRPSAEALDLSVYLGSNRSTIQIGSVMSNADTESQGGATLGQYAGRGIGDNQGHFSYEAKEHGIFIITNELQVKSSYWQGLRPECTLIDREDFFQPEFDNVGVDAIDRMQLFSVDLIGSDAEKVFGGQGIEYPFGFTPRYSKLKVNFDSLLGDFRFKTKNTGLDSWYLARYFDGETNYEIDENFSLMTQRNTSTQYDHIFQVADNSADHFYSVFSLDFTAYRHMKTISEALDTEEGSDRIDVDFNGGVD